MTPRFFQTPRGEELVILPREDYDRLIAMAAEAEEDDADVAMYDARRLVNSPTLPPDVSGFMLRGDSLLKAVRKWRDQTQVYVELKTGIGQGYLSDLENGRRKGSPEVLAKLAEVFDVPKEWFVTD